MFTKALMRQTNGDEHMTQHTVYKTKQLGYGSEVTTVDKRWFTCNRCELEIHDDDIQILQWQWGSGHCDGRVFHLCSGCVPQSVKDLRK